MKHSLSLVLPALLVSAGAAAGQTSQPAQPPEPAQKPPVTLTELGALPEAAGVPVIASPDGKRLLCVKKVYEEIKPAAPGGRPRRKRSFVYVRTDADGKNPTEIFTTKVPMDDFLVAYATPAQFSGDGKLLVLPQTAGKGRGDPIFPVVLNEQGDRTRIQTQLPEAMGFGYAGQSLIVLEGTGFRKGPAGGKWRLVSWSGGKATELGAGTEVAYMVRIAPDASKVAIILLADPRARQIKVRVFDLKTKKPVDSPPFRSDDVTFDGPPLIYWDAESKGVYYHAIPQGGGKSDCALTRFDVAKKTAAPVVPWPGFAVTAVLDAGHLAVMTRRGRRSGILRLSDKAFFPFPAERTFALGGRGKRVFLYGRDPQTRKRRTFAAELSLPKK